MNYNTYKDRSISPDSNLLEAFNKMDALDKKLLIVEEQNLFVGLISAGDIQRAIIKKKPLNTTIIEVIRTTIRIAKINDSFESIKRMMFEHRMELCPVINENNEIVKVYFWEDFFKSDNKDKNVKLSLPVVIMAGGQGTRMKPLTNIIPKPLIPFGDNSIIEEIISRFQDFGCNSFFASINYKSELIEYYFNQIKNKPYNINFFKENKPLGTAGSLHLLKGQIDSTFFVSNCDILINDDYEAMYEYHKKNNNELTIISAIKDYSIPYGTLITKNEGLLSEITEKPNINFQINTGFYIVEPHLIDEIPQNEFFHITHLIEILLKQKRKVGVFPVSSGSWIDIGVWSEYLKHIKIDQ